MEKIRNLNFYQKAFLILMIIMVLIFTVVYPVTISKAGFEYKDTILVPRQKNGCMVYYGKIQGQQANFIVAEDKTLIFQYGDKTYGPYTAKEDSTAIPKDSGIKEHMTGMELRQGEDILFRGGVYESGDDYWLYNEDGTLHDIGFFVIAGDGIERDEHGNIIDPMKPSASTTLPAPIFTVSPYFSRTNAIVLFCHSVKPSLESIQRTSAPASISAGILCS